MVVCNSFEFRLASSQLFSREIIPGVKLHAKVHEVPSVSVLMKNSLFKTFAVQKHIIYLYLCTRT